MHAETIYSIGHGNKPLDEFLSILHAYKIESVADIRSYPYSKRNPQFNQQALKKELPKTNISYLWLKELGGFRKTGLGSASPNVALRSQGYRNYADHMFSNAFKEGGERLLCVGRKGKTAFMCAETLPFRCHRWLLSDHLVSNNIQVLHIIDERKAMIHKLSQHATIRNGNVVYDH